MRYSNTCSAWAGGIKIASNKNGTLRRNMNLTTCEDTWICWRDNFIVKIYRFSTGFPSLWSISFIVAYWAAREFQLLPGKTPHGLQWASCTIRGIRVSYKGTTIKTAAGILAVVLQVFRHGAECFMTIFPADAMCDTQVFRDKVLYGASAQGTKFLLLKFANWKRSS